MLKRNSKSPLRSPTNGGVISIGPSTPNQSDISISKSYATALNVMHLLPQRQQLDASHHSVGRSKDESECNECSADLTSCQHQHCKWREFSRRISVQYEEMKDDFHRLVNDITNLQNKCHSINMEKAELKIKVQELQEANAKLTNAIQQYTPKHDVASEPLTPNKNDMLVDQSAPTDIKLQMLSQTVRAIREKLSRAISSDRSINTMLQISICNQSVYKKVAESNYQQSALLAEQLICVRTNIMSSALSPGKVPVMISPQKPQQHPYVSNYHTNSIKKEKSPKL